MTGSDTCAKILLCNTLVMPPRQVGRKWMRKRGESSVTVELNDNESFDSLLRRFNRQVMTNGVLKEVRRKRWFITKGEQQRMDVRKGRRRARIRQLRSEKGEA